MTESHDLFMARAVTLAEGGFPAPNPRVGCVIVKDGKIIAEGYHDHAGADHAEVDALYHATADPEGATVYVTQEPCNHFGRTPPCTDALIAAKVKEVFIATKDPNPIASGGIEKLNGAGIRTGVGLGAELVEALNWIYLTAIRRARPVVSVKAATTLDGFMARIDGTSKWITGQAARNEGHRLRAEMGSVCVGRGTVQADDPLLTARIPGVVNQPLRVVLDPKGVLRGVETVFGPDAETLWVVGDGTAPNGRQRQVPGKESLDLRAVLEELFQRGQIGVLVEGGPRTIRKFFEQGLVDRLELFIGPRFFGEGLPFLGSNLGSDDLNLCRLTHWDDDVHMTFGRGCEPPR